MTVSKEWREHGIRVLLLISLVLLALLTWRIRQVRAAHRELFRRTTHPHVGLYVPTFSTTSLTGSTVTVGRTAAGQKQLLFVFTTTCAYCRATLPAWSRLATTVDSSHSVRVEVLGISLDSAEITRSYSTNHELRYPVVLFPEPKLRPMYRANAVPLTMLLDHEGEVLYSRFGVLDRAAEDSLRRLLQF